MTDQQETENERLNSEGSLEDADLKSDREEEGIESHDGPEVMEAQAGSESGSEQGSTEDFEAKFYYLAAELENVKKRNAKELQRTLKFGNERVLGDLIEVLDNFSRVAMALENDQDEKIKNFKIGMDMVSKQFKETLERHGLKEISSVGEVLDPTRHEAVGTEVNESKENQTILREFLKGYELNGRVLRAAKVIVVQN